GSVDSPPSSSSGMPVPLSKSSCISASSCEMYVAPLVCSMRRAASSARVEIEDLIDGATADGAERHGVAGKHDAVGLRAEVAARLVVGALEGADSAGERTGAELRGVVLLLLAEQRVHLGLGPVRRANGAPLLLDVARVPLEVVFQPRRRQ